MLGPVGVDHRRRLGDLDDHARRIHAVLVEPLHDAFDQVRLPELSGREVEARAHGDPAALPVAQLLGELADDPVADRRDQPELLGERDELARLDQSAVGAPPADQGLDARHALTRELDDGLVVEEPLPRLDRPPKTRGEREEGRGDGLVRVDEELARTRALALVHDRVGLFQERLR